jgi:Ni/Fe-hydrogenase subunit HybB-like protein
MNVLTPLSRITILLLGAYLAIKVGDLVSRGAYATLLDGSAQSNAFLVEVGLGVILPWVMLLFPAVRRSRRWLFAAALLIVSGVMLNRFNVFVVSF